MRIFAKEKTEKQLRIAQKQLSYASPRESRKQTATDALQEQGVNPCYNHAMQSRGSEGLQIMLAKMDYLNKLLWLNDTNRYKVPRERIRAVAGKAANRMF